MTFSIKTLKLVGLILIGFFGILNVSAQDNSDIKLDCFSILVGKDASTDGSVIFGHNEDTGMKLVNTYKVPRMKHKQGEVITLKNGGTLAQVKETFAYLWLNMPDIDVCDTYMNEFGVSIGSDGCPSKEKDPELTDGGIVFWLRRAVAERAKTAREGVEIAGKLIDQYGYDSSGRTYIIADSNEGWLLSAVNGKHWVAQRVPDDKIAVIPNYYTIGEINLSDSANFLGSPDIVKYAIKKGWYNPEEDGIFHFSRAYSNPGSLSHNGNINRMWQGVNLVSGQNYGLKSELPFAVKPKYKVTVQNIMAVLRDHYIGTELDKTMNYLLGSPYKLNGPTICAGSTQYSTISHLRGWLPAELGAVMWVSQYRPDIQMYIPFYSSVQSIPEILGFGDYNIAIKQQFKPVEKTFDKSNGHAFWKYVDLVKMIDKDYTKNAPAIQRHWSKAEAKLSNKQIRFESKIFKSYQTNSSEAKKAMTKYCSDIALKNYKKTIKLIGN